MARENIVRITSDLTGNEYRGEDFPPVKVSVNGKGEKPVTGELDLTPADLDALIAFVQGDHGAKLRTLLAPAPASGRRGRPRASAPPSGDGSGQREHSDDEKTAAKHFMASVGKPYSGKGKIPQWAYDEKAPEADQESPAAGS